MQDLPLQNPRHKELASGALRLWFPEAQFLFEPIQGGRPTVELLIVDISGISNTGFPPGKYVLRIGPAEDDVAYTNEQAAHQHVVDACPAFADKHIPRLLRLQLVEENQDRWVISLHDLAGGSLRRFAPPMPESTGLLSVAEVLPRDLLDAWARPDSIKLLPQNQVLRDMVGESRTGPCLEAVAAVFSGPETLVHYENGHTFLNPAAILNVNDKSVEIPVMTAFCHCDLHVGNIHVSDDEPDLGHYWIMDVSQAREGFVGYDHAYLEVSVLLNYASTLNMTVLAQVLEAAELGRAPVPSGTYWLITLMTKSREAINDWIHQQPGREDDLRRQFMIMRMVAALKWARRFPQGSDKCRLCVAYAGWYALRTQREYPQSIVATENNLTNHGDGSDNQHRETVAVVSALWESFWTAVEGFAPNGIRYVLISEQLPQVAELASLGQLPWSMVVDLDPSSDNDGLYAAAAPVLATERSLHTLSSIDRPLIDFTRGTAWLLSTGSSIRREPFLPFREWVYQRLNVIRQLITMFRMSIGDSQVIVVIIPTKTDAAAIEGGRDRLIRVLETVDEMLEGRARYVQVGLASMELPVECSRVPLAAEDFLQRVAGTFGDKAQVNEYGLPGVDGKRITVTPETMRVLQEHFEILHDNIEGWDLGTTRTDEAFWRGGLISWADLDAGRDVARTINARLTQQLTSSLDHHRTRTIVLHHQPGTGGTTAALRAAWDLHHRYPVAVLRMGIPVEGHRIQALADRLHRLFVLTEMPILFVAEDGDLSEANREILYRELATRSARVTILYIRRVRGSVDDNALAVSEPLDAEEATSFQKQYGRLAEDSSRANELALLSTTEYERYRTPFFYGLITFEREFTKISKYVSDHLEQIRGRVQSVMEFIALATIFSNTGLQRELVQRLLHVSPEIGPNLDDLLGAGPARLVTTRIARLRLLHQLLAEEVLSELLGGGSSNWETNLGNLAIDFIQAICVASDPTSDPIRLLFRQVFIDRQSGGEDGAEDRMNFAPLIERLDAIDPSLGHKVLKTLTEFVPEDPHFWNHLGRHQMYRLNRDLDRAEEYVEKATELAPEDHVHYHTLGLVRRSRMRQAIRTARNKGVVSVLQAIDQWFYRTADCFDRARDLSPEDIYSYITHVQAIIDVAKALMGAARVTSVAELTSDAGDWIAENLTVANELLDVAVQLYGTLERRDDYLNRCLADIRRLYGDLDSVIELWETATAGPLNTSMSRRSLAQAYYVRGNRNWRDLTEAELTRIVELANQNLSYPGAKEEDYRLWFEAFKLLPSFEVDEALGRLQQWTTRFPSWRAEYYRYCLLFYLWFTLRVDKAEAFRAAQQESLAHILGRAKRSFLWLAKTPSWCPLVSDTDLGEWDRQQNFWQESSLLQRVNGVIDYMNGPQAGAIQLDRGVSAFFVPAAGDFLPDSDEGIAVNFFLGFSPEGLRAWHVRRGHSAEAVWARNGQPTGEIRLVDRAPRHVTSQAATAEAVSVQRQRLSSFCLAVLEARASIGLDTRLSEIEMRARATFRAGEIANLRELLGASSRIRIGSGEDPPIMYDVGQGKSANQVEGETQEAGYVSFISGDRRSAVVELARGGRISIEVGALRSEGLWSGIRRGQVVRCTVSETLRGPVARDVEILSVDASLMMSEVVDPVDLPTRLEGALRSELEDRLARGERDSSAREIEEALCVQFRGALSLSQRLGASSFAQFASSLDWTFVSFRTRDPRIRIRDGMVFGRTRTALRSPEGRSETLDVDVVLSAAVAEAKSSGKEASLQWLGGALRTRLGTKAYERLFGRGLKITLTGLPGWQMEETRPGFEVLRPTQSDQ